MALMNMNDLMEVARRNHTMIPAFNTTNLEMTLAIMDALEQAGMPGVVQIAPTNVKLSSYEQIAAIAQAADLDHTVAMALHLDHGRTLDDIRQAVQAGFTSVMIDGAALPFDENVQLTRRAVEYCHAQGVSVEAELGAIRGKEDDHVSEADCRTDPDQVVEFVEQTGCDLLAVSIGNVHGLEETPHIDLDHLKRIYEISPCPLVLHGGSGIPYQTICAMREYGVIKVNIASDLRRAFIATVAQAQKDNPQEANLAKVLLDARAAVTQTACHTALAINGFAE